MTTQWNLIQWFKQISMKSDIFSGWTFKTFLRYFCFHDLWIQVFRCKYHKSSATRLLSTNFKFKVGLNNKCQLVVKWFLIFWKIFLYNFSPFLSNHLSHTFIILTFTMLSHKIWTDKTLEFDIDEKIIWNYDIIAKKEDKCLWYTKTQSFFVNNSQYCQVFLLPATKLILSNQVMLLL